MKLFKIITTALLLAFALQNAAAQAANIDEEAGLIWANYQDGNRVVISLNSNMLHLIHNDECTAYTNMKITRTDCDITVANEAVKCTLDFITGDCNLEQVLRSVYRR
jgi:hypothetical protein